MVNLHSGGWTNNNPVHVSGSLFDFANRIPFLCYQRCVPFVPLNEIENVIVNNRRFSLRKRHRDHAASIAQVA
jgi:hypothetical protein